MSIDSYKLLFLPRCHCRCYHISKTSTSPIGTPSKHTHSADSRAAVCGKTESGIGEKNTFPKFHPYATILINQITIPYRILRVRRVDKMHEHESRMQCIRMRWKKEQSQNARDAMHWIYVKCSLQLSNISIKMYNNEQTKI